MTGSCAMTYEKALELFQPVKVLFGSGQISGLGMVARPLGSRALLLTMPEMVRLGMADKAMGLLKESGLDALLFDGVESEPTCTHVELVSKLVRDSKAEVLVALGGGSVIDVAKASAIRSTHEEPVWMYANLSNRPPLPVEASTLPVIAVPTTAGTGSEVTPYAVLSNDETVQKGTIKSPYIFPRAAIVDPDLTLGMGQELTSSTGIDAFSHALESYLNIANRTPFSVMVARESMRVLYETLPDVARNGGDIALRAKIAWSSMLAGIAIANAGTTVAHAMAQPLGARAHLPHALTVALFTLPVLHHTWQAATPLFSELASILDPVRAGSMGQAEGAEEAVVMIEELFREVDMYHKISEYGVNEDLLGPLLEDVTGYMSRPLAQHPKIFAADEVRQIINEAFI